MNGQQSSWGGFFRSRSGLVLVGFLAIAGFYLLTEHTTRFFAALPFLVFLACPVMMMFMMRGMHGDHGGQGCHGGHSDETTHKGEKPQPGGEL